jgi:hypothetical protein
MLRQGLGPLVIATLATACTCSARQPPSDDATAREEASQAEAQRRAGTHGGSGELNPLRRNVGGEPHVVLLMVTDTVRADHTSLCGYGRPTTPYLKKLVEAGASFTCDAYAPAPWTLPSHASYFTGLPVTEHQTMFVANSDVSINATITARPLATDFTTLAETYRERGYQTVAISANSIINPASGLLQGFDVVKVSPNGMTLRGRALGTAVRETLDTLDPAKPLFLFVNSYDAHDPYPAVPAGVPWLPAQGRGKIDAYTKSPDNPYYAFLNGLMPEAQKPAFLSHLTDTYDYGIAFADANVGVVVGALNRGKWTQKGYRLLITADHGEFLGEHGLLRHCGYVWEPVVNVPMVYVDSTRRTKFHFPEPFSAAHAFHLLRDGHLPETGGLPAHSVSEKNPDDILGGTIAGAVWGKDGQKWTCVEGKSSMWDLNVDPDERNPAPLGTEGPGPGLLQTLCTDIDALHQLAAPAVDPTLTAALKAMGYASDEEAPAEALPTPDAGGL